MSTTGWFRWPHGPTTIRRTTIPEPACWYGEGSVLLTALARHVLPDHLADAGITVREPAADPRHAPAAHLLGDFYTTGDRSVTRRSDTAELVDGIVVTTIPPGSP